MRILDIALKDLKRSYRSAFAVGMSIAAPLLLIGLFYLAFGNGASGETELAAIQVGVVNGDSLPMNAPLERSLGEEVRGMFFDENVESWIFPRDYQDEAAAKAAVEKGEIGAAVIIPQGFTKSVLAGKGEAQILIFSDPTLTIGSQVVRDMVGTMLEGVEGGRVAFETVFERRQAVGLEPAPTQITILLEQYTTWFVRYQEEMFLHPERASLVIVTPEGEGDPENPVQGMLGLMMAGQMAFFAFFTGAYSMMSVLREQEEGTLARLFTTTVGGASILAGKFLAVLLSVIVQGIILILAARYAFKIDWGDPLAVVLALSGQVVAATGLGVLLISFVKTSQQGGPVLGGGLTVLGMLGGLFTAVLPMPEAFTRLALFTPQGWVLESWKNVLRGAPTEDMLVPFGVITVMGIVMFMIGVIKFRNRFI